MGFSLSAYLSGLAILLAAAAPLAAASALFARSTVDAERRHLRWAVALFAFCLAVVVVSQVLGAAGLYSRVFVLVGSWLASALLWAAATLAPQRLALAPTGWRASPDDEAAATVAEPDSQRAPDGAGTGGERGRDWFRILVRALLAGICVTAFVTSVVKPSYGSDAVNYHLPDIANWVRDHSLWQVRQFQLGVYQNAYPMNSEAISAFFVVTMERDHLVNLGVLVQFALVAASAAALVEHVAGIGAAREGSGARFVRHGGALLVGLAAATMPIVATSHIGSVGSDLLPIAGVTLTLLFVDRWRRTEAPVDLAVAALALGIAFGSKFTSLVYVPLIGVGLVVLVLWRRRWWQALVLLPLAFALPSAFWFVRNVVAVGNPLWPFELLGLPTGFVRDNEDRLSILGWFASGGPRAVFLTGLYYAVAALGATALVVAGIPHLWRALRRDGTRIWFFLAVPLLAIPLLWAQDWTSGRDGFNVPATARYVGATYAVLLAVAMGRALSGRRGAVWRWALLCAVAIDAAVAFLAPTLPSLRVAGSALLVGVVAGGLVLAWGVVGSRWQPSRPALASGVFAAGVIVLVAAAPRWQANWYRSTAEANRAALYRTVQDLPVRGAKVAVAGLFHTYPLYGPDLTNEVVFVGDGPEVDPWDPSSREAWLDALRHECIDYVAVADDEEHWLHPIPELEFVARTPELEPVFVTGSERDQDDPRVALYRLDNDCVDAG